MSSLETIRRAEREVVSLLWSARSIFRQVAQRMRLLEYRLQAPELPATDPVS